MIILTSAVIVLFFLDVTTAADPECLKTWNNPDSVCLKPFSSKPGLSFDCAIENKRMMEIEAPGWAGKMGKNFSPFSEGWEPILESITGCNKISSNDVDPPLLSFEYLCVMDREWIQYYEDNKQDFANQGYYTLLTSVNIMWDRVSYLFEQQFGYKLSCKRVIAAPKLTHQCEKDNRMEPEGNKHIYILSCLTLSILFQLTTDD